jgi:hypothetical protein
MQFTIQLGNISVEASDTDPTLLKKAKKHLPHALEYLGKRIAQEAWKTIEEPFSRSPVKFDRLRYNKSKFISDKTAEFTKKATVTYKNNLTKDIFEQLQKQRNMKADR